MSDDAKVNALIARWISDYRSRALWKIFDEMGHLKSVDSKNFDVAAPVLRQTEGPKGDTGGKVTAPVLSADDVELRSWLLVELMKRLTNGRDTATTSSAGVVDELSRAAGDKIFDRTALEEAVDILDRIVEETNVSDLVTHAEVSRLRLALKRQAVYVCCRAGKYDLSVSVFERQWTHWKNEREMDARRQVSEVMAARNKDHPMLNDDPYGALVNEGRAFLRKAFSALPVPFLVKAAHNVCEKIDKMSAATPSTNLTSIGSPVVTTPAVAKKPNGNMSGGLVQPIDSAGKVKRGRPAKLPTSPKSATTKKISPIHPVQAAAVGSKENLRQSKAVVEEIKTEHVEGDSDTDIQDEGASSTSKKRKRNSSVVAVDADSLAMTKAKRPSRRESVSWSTEDEELIFVGALKYGVGRWSDVARALPGRSHLEIKEKWRTMLQEGKVELYEKIHGQLPVTSPTALL